MNALSLLRGMARNNAWANHRLHAAVAAMDDGSYRAVRTSFFPSVHLTLVHILLVDRFYVGALDGSEADPARVWAEEARWVQDATFLEVQSAQRAVDRRLVEFVTGLSADRALEQSVQIPRRDRVQVERRSDVLLHLLQHQIHHRGQVHAMLAGTSVKPPPLDEFFLAGELPLREAELRALGLPPCDGG